MNRLATALLFFAVNLPVAAQATELGVSNGAIKAMTATIDGPYDPTGTNRWRLGAGAHLRIRDRTQDSSESLKVVEAPVDVQCGAGGILYASGGFVIDITRAGGVRYRFPRNHPSFSQNAGVPNPSRMVFSKSQPPEKAAGNWVALLGDQVLIRGMASAQAIHPATPEGLETLVSVSGYTSESRVLSDLRTLLQFDGNPFPFWRAARADLDSEERAVKGLVIPEDRVGAEAYRAYQVETLAGLSKIREGYRMLQRNLYSDKVLDKMVTEGVPIPRLTLAEVSFVRGDMAFSIRPFVNWKLEGRVLVDRSRLVASEPRKREVAPTVFVVDDLTNRMLEDTRIVIGSRDAVIESRRPGNTAWTARAPIQFDFDWKRFFTPSAEVFGFSEQLDATGFLLRREISGGGVLEMSELFLSKTLLELRYLPRSDRKPAEEQIRKYMDLRRTILYPDRRERLALLPTRFREGQVSEFLSDGLDHLVAAIHAQGMKEVVGLNLWVRNDPPKQWTLEMEAIGPAGERVMVSRAAELPDAPPLEDSWKKLDRNRAITGWLDLEWE
ncbi:MAG: hypothetical protein HUU16_15185 [Candidatus Omnitrophica bacterium]|nr:hypothetical protein [Candidatus Omnitrophota bacterium]